MYLARSANQFPFDKVAQGSVVTIGTFDGLHLGHQKLLRKVVREAEARKMASVVMSFEPIPMEFFSADSPPARLMRFREKFEALKEFGIDIFFCPRFNANMRNIRADDFIRQILVHTLNMRYIEIGDDFRFAKNREGSVEKLMQVAKALDFQVEQAGSVVVGDERVSSTSVRDALWNGELDRVERLLGRPYRMSGTVIEGQKLGRTLGYPTANIGLHRRQSPVMGIFAVRVHGVGAEPMNAVASVGTRPTFNGIKPLLEVHLFDFDDDIYGQYLQVDFVARIRDELKFERVVDLIEQMDRDSEQARAILGAL